MQAVVLLLLGVSLCGVCGSEDRSRVQRDVVQLQNTPRVVFHAVFNDGSRTEQYRPVDAAFTLKYKNIVTNIGNGYNSETGLFTAPVRGVYVFYYMFFSAGHTPTQSSFIYLKKNTEVLVETIDHVSRQDGHDSGSNVAVVTLEQGDTVSVELQAITGFGILDRSTTFSGFLLSALAPPPQ